MPSEKLTRILMAKSPFTHEQIASMSEREGWAWVYTNAPPAKEKLPEVCFTGFDPDEKEELRGLAEENGFKVVTCVTKNLAILCTGEYPGPSKIKEAMEKGVYIIKRAEFERLVETVEITWQEDK
jgi:NAD-dependent DNA ligase